MATPLPAFHDLLRQQGQQLPAAEVDRKFFGPATRQAIQQLQSQTGLPVTGEVDDRTARVIDASNSGANPLATVPAAMIFNPAASSVVTGIPAPPPPPSGGGTPSGSGSVRGTLVFDNGLPGSGVAVRAYNIGYAGQDARLGETKSDGQGNYSLSWQLPRGQAPNLQLRVVDSKGNEVTISNTKFGAQTEETLNLVVPSTVQPIAPEFQRLAADMDKHIGGITKLGLAKEGAERQDLTLINRSTNWDARLVALAGTAAQQTAATGLGHDALYALYRVGLPSDPTQLAMVASGTVEGALKKATEAAIVSMNADQIASATAAFQKFAIKTRLTLTTAGAVSTYGQMLTTTLADTTQQSAFANLYFTDPSAGADLWAKAAKLNIPAQALDTLKVQGRLLYLTYNNNALAQKLQKDIGSLANLSHLADKDYHQPATWSADLTALAGSGGDAALQALIPAIYSGEKTADRLLAYSADMARKVRFSFPTQVTARLIETKQLAVDGVSAPKVTAFLRAAAPLGYQLGRTPLNTFLTKSGQSLPGMDAASTDSLKTVHRLYQITPSNESLQASLNLGFKSARDIVSYTKDEFVDKYAGSFPPGEVHIVYSKAQQISAVTFNFYMMAKQMDTSPPLFALSASSDDLQNAKNAIVQQFPTITGLFGSLDFCQCQECQSVLSPAAYFVDLLEFLRQAEANPAGHTPLDVLVGQQKLKIAAAPTGATEAGSTVTLTTLKEHGLTPGKWAMVAGVGVAGYNGTFQITSVPTPTTFTYANAATGLTTSGGGTVTAVADAHAPLVLGRRPDLGALPLTCENTNTAMPYIDLVNEILEYYIAHSGLDAGAACDTGGETTADLTAEPQHVLASVYDTNLKQAVYPLNLPFDLWIETVRAFFKYFKSPLAQVLDTLRPADNLGLFTDGSAYPYYQAQIFAESLGLSPSEYTVLTATDPVSQKASVQNWFQLYGYSNESTASSELMSAKTSSQRLGLTYQELTDLVTTGFLNPGLNSIAFQFERFGIEMSDAFAYTGQPGYTASAGQARADFEALLDAITARYTSQNSTSTFNARTWLANLLPADYSRKVLILRDPAAGCDFTSTTLQYADGTAPAKLDFLKFNMFVRLWKKLGWTLDETDWALQAFFPPNLPPWTDANFANAFSAAWKTVLVYVAHLDDLNARLAPAMGRAALLPLWTDLSVQANDSLYAQLFLTPTVLNNDWAFDDPNGKFPTSASDLPAPLQLFSAHLPSVQGALGLTADEVTAILNDASVSPDTATFTLPNLSICYRYSLLAKCLQFSVADMIALKAMSGLNPFMTLTGTALSTLSDDVLLNQTLAFVKQVTVAQNSGFSVEDLKYLLRHQFDPVGKYQSDPNALLALVQTMGSGLQQIQTQNAVPANLPTLPDAQIDQRLSGLFPATILKSLFALLTNSQTYSAAQGAVAPVAQIDTMPFAGETELTLTYDPVTQTQTVTYQGLLTDWKKGQLLQINNSALFAALLAGVQQQAQQAFNQSIENILGAWASLAEYEAVQTGVVSGLLAPPLTQKDPALRLSYDQADQFQWLGYRGVLTDAKLAALTGVNNSAVLLNLLKDVQNQATPSYKQLVGTILAMWANVQTYSVTQVAVPAANRIDSNGFFAALTAAEQNGSISGPVPTIQLVYDPAIQIQGLTCEGVLTEAMRGQLAALLPASTVLANLLQAARNQPVQLFQTLATNLFTVAAIDLDQYSQPFLGLDATRQQKQVKAQLVMVFLPLLCQKLSRDLVIQTLTANLGSDPSLTGTLVDDAALLSDPSNPGKSLLGSFLALGQQGVSATYYSTANGSGPALATATAVTTDTSDPTNPNAGKAGTGSAHFEGYLQVPTDGPYRFLAELGNTGATAVLQLTPPDPTALLANPIIPSTPAAAKDNDEVSQFVQLRGGLPYDFTLDFSNLGADGATLLIQGENLAKGPLSQVVLYPQAGITAFTRARVLLSKALRILQVTGLDEREVSYLAANAARFGNLNFSALPTQTADDSVANAKALFSQFLTLADYADLRKGPAGKSDGLVDVFQAAADNVTLEPNTPWTLFARLTRRDPKVVKDVAMALGAVSHFMDNTGIRRIWNALQLTQIMGIPVSTLAASTLIASLSPPTSAPAPEDIATNLKNAVRARFTPDAWRAIAKSIFDKLRQRKRDSLVAYLVNALPLEDENQLFEYFLVDPGMEPVVQTSRLRLALSSVQTFIQRCLLNLENANNKNPERNVAPNAIDANWWDWMKRYRVWQANREIFLFPENWMIPELRLDKTDLFQTLESDLLQGDVTSDLVDDAFFTYLKGLDVRARLDIVATYLDQDPNHLDISTLYVLGRTYGHPHKYFFRTYSNGTWSGWQALTQDIDGNHIVQAIWRGRLNLFWVTFIQTTAPPAASTDNDKSVANLTFGELSQKLSTVNAQIKVQVQLHWIEYFQGKWSNRISTDVNASSTVAVHNPFDASTVYIHVSKEINADQSEGAVKIHLDFPIGFVYQAINAVASAALAAGDTLFYNTLEPIAATYKPFANRSFRVTSKNCAPDCDLQYWEPAPEMVYTAPGVDATLHTGSGNLQVNFQSHLGSDRSSQPANEKILDSVHNYAILTCANAVAPPFLPPTDPSYSEAGALVSPFFFKDTANPNVDIRSTFFDELTFFVQPSLTEATMEQWEGWAIAPTNPLQEWVDPKVLNNVEVAAQFPTASNVPVNPGDPAFSKYSIQTRQDWATNPATVISFGSGYVGKSGGISLAAGSAVAGGISNSRGGLTGLAGSALGTQGAASGRAVMVVGGQGLRPGQFQSVKALQGSVAARNAVSLSR